MGDKNERNHGSFIRGTVLFVSLLFLLTAFINSQYNPFGKNRADVRNHNSSGAKIAANSGAYPKEMPGWYAAYYAVLRNAIEQFGIARGVFDKTSLFYPLTAGLQYARLIDFDIDGQPELFFTLAEFPGGDVAFVYGYSDGSAKQLLSAALGRGNFRYGFYLAFAEDGRTFLVDDHAHTGSGFSRSYFYTVEHNQGVRVLARYSICSWRFFRGGSIEGYAEQFGFGDDFTADLFADSVTRNESGEWIAIYRHFINGALVDETEYKYAPKLELGIIRVAGDLGRDDYSQSVFRDYNYKLFDNPEVVHSTLNKLREL